MKPQKSRLLTLLNILTHKTDKDHPITISEIIPHLNAVGITADRKTIYKDIETLQSLGIDIICRRKQQNQYFIENRHFELSELTLLVDAVQAAKFISVKDSQDIIRKLSSFASVHQAERLKRRLYVEKQVKSANEKVLTTVDLLHTAINRGIRIEFQYFEYSAHKKKLLKHGGKVYSFSPYAMLWNNDCYYALGYSDQHEKVITFRVDRIANPALTKRKAIPKPKGFKAEKYAQAVFQMFDGETQTVTLRCENHLMKSIIDRFGIKVKTEVEDDKHFIATVDVSVSNTFFGWVVGFGGGIEIVTPQTVKNQYNNILNKTFGKSHE